MQPATEARPLPLLSEIILAVERAFGMPGLQRDKSRMPAFIEAREMFAYLARTTTHESYPSIGDFMGRCHTSVIHMFRRAEARAKSEARMRHGTWSGMPYTEAERLVQLDAEERATRRLEAWRA